MSANLTLTDLFCGAGGSSTGAVAIPGVQVSLAANHWKLAVETHNANHPNTRHDCADISQTDPRRYPHTDLLWASPECTTHSRAKGRKAPTRQPDLFGETLPDEAAERSRATMWDVVRFSEQHLYRGVIVENVIEVTKWLPFCAWLAAMRSLGYDHKVVSLNSMHAQARGLPAPQSRDRVYVVFWRQGQRRPDLEWMQRPKAWCSRCETFVDAIQAWKKPGMIAGRYREQYVYRCPNVACRGSVVEPGWLPALSFIDLSNVGQRIGDRARPLSEKTMRRIEHGIRKFWCEPFLTETVNGYDAADPNYPKFMDPQSYWRTWSALEPMRTQHSRESKALVLSPVLIPVEGRESGGPISAMDPMRTQTSRSETAVAFPPLVQSYYGHGGVAPATEVVRTLTTVGHQALLSGPAWEVEDAYMRMLEPAEIKRGMAFPAEYVMLGTRREQVRLSGNAVTPPAARDIVGALAEAITGEVAA